MNLESQYDQLNLDGIKRYIETGCETMLGGFTTSLINNDLASAVGRADHINIELIPVYVHWLYNNAPAGSWGHANASTQWADILKQIAEDKADE